MSEFLLYYYDSLRAIHIIAIIAWMAGLLYLPRLYVYHAAAQPGSEMSETFKIMEYRLLRIIMNPAMIVSWLLGLAMLWANPTLLDAGISGGWMHAKLTAVIALTAVHMVFAKWRKAFAGDRNSRSPRFYKIWNEAPTVLMIFIVICAVVEPF